MHPLVRLARFARIDSAGHIAAYSAISAAFCAAVAIGVLRLFFVTLPLVLPQFLVQHIYMAAAGIAVLIALPITAVLLVMLRLIADAISRLDDHVRHDPLTGVMTRAAFLHAAQAACRDGGAFLMVDADRFKVLNDTHGHAAGDLALQLIARAIGVGAGSGALVGRLGGEEFGVWLSGPSDDAARDAAAGIVDAVRRLRFDPGTGPLPLSVSVGVAVDGRGATPGALMRLADGALYVAKRGGRDRFVMARADLPPVALEAA